MVRKKGGNCDRCGKYSEVLEICHKKDGYGFFEFLCPRCHATTDRRIKEIDFLRFLSELIQQDDEYDSVEIEPRMGEERILCPDLVITTKAGKKILVECKSSTAIGFSVVRSAIAQLDRYSTLDNFERRVLAIPGRLSCKMRDFLEENDIELWDIDYILARYREAITARKDTYYGRFFRNVEPEKSSPEQELITKLKECQRGKKSWAEYQKLVGQIIEHLFGDNLTNPLSESADYHRINRRDWIYSNYSENSFWKYMREEYKAHYVVVDAKNYTNKITKNCVIQIGNYLKEHGAGLFGIICGRSGCNKSASLTIRELWILHRKMIIVLDDTDIETMLLAKSTNGKPEDVIGNKIMSLRLSM